MAFVTRLYGPRNAEGYKSEVYKDNKDIPDKVHRLFCRIMIGARYLRAVDWLLSCEFSGREANEFQGAGSQLSEFMLHLSMDV